MGAFFAWRTFRNPYDDKYFTAALQEKYPSVESVVDAFRNGWNGESRAGINLLNEVYGWDKFTNGHIHDGEIPPVKNIHYFRSRELAVVRFEKTAWWFLWRNNRWVFYPETPWLGFIEILHSL